MVQDDLDRAFEKIYRSFNRYGRQLTDDRERHPEYTARLLTAVDRPDLAARNVLVTGSKGKGSTAHFIAQLLGAFDAPVGLFTSPHLLDSLERIRVDGAMISEQEFATTFSAIEPSLDTIWQELSPPSYIGPVGIFAAMAAWHFRQRQVHWGIYETGRGALFDDVTQINHEAAVITEVLAEHVRELGPTLESIAWHKAGSITPHTRTVVLGTRRPVLINAVQDRLAQLGIAPMVWVVPDHVQVADIHMGVNGTTFDLAFADGRRWNELRIPAVGALVQNLATAITVVESLTHALSEPLVREIAATLSWPGRGQVLSADPFVLLDAGVRPESVADLLTNLGPFDQVVLSIPDGKDRLGMVEVALVHARQIVLTGCSNKRLAYHFENDPAFPRTRVIPDVQTALSEVLSAAQTGERVLLCGTISFIADVYRHYGLTVG